MGKVHAVVISDYAKGAVTRELCEAVIREALRRSVPVLVDPKTPDFSKYSGATMVCPNLQELSVATGVEAKDVAGLLKAGEGQRVEHDVTYLTVTMSERGNPGAVCGGRVSLGGAGAGEVFDVSGAGDTVIATMAAGLAAGLRMETSVDLANLAAGIVWARWGRWRLRGMS